MLRNLLAVVSGYLVLAILTMLSILLLMVAFPDYAAAGASETEPPLVPVLCNLFLGTFAAFVGGYCTAFVAREHRLRCVVVLAGIVLVLGIVHWITGRGGPRPDWYLALLPVTGSLGVLFGGWVCG